MISGVRAWRLCTSWAGMYTQVPARASMTSLPSNCDALHERWRRAARAAVQGATDRHQDLIDGDATVSVCVALITCGDIIIAQRDLHHHQQLVDGNDMIFVAVAGASDRDRRRRGRRRQRFGRRRARRGSQRRRCGRTRSRAGELGGGSRRRFSGSGRIGRRQGWACGRSRCGGIGRGSGAAGAERRRTGRQRGWRGRGSG